MKILPHKNRNHWGPKCVVSAQEHDMSQVIVFAVGDKCCRRIWLTAEIREASGWSIYTCLPWAPSNGVFGYEPAFAITFNWTIIEISFMSFHAHTEHLQCCKFAFTAVIPDGHMCFLLTVLVCKKEKVLNFFKGSKPSIILLVDLINFN